MFAIATAVCLAIIAILGFALWAVLNECSELRKAAEEAYEISDERMSEIMDLEMVADNLEEHLETALTEKENAYVCLEMALRYSSPNPFEKVTKSLRAMQKSLEQVDLTKYTNPI